MALCKTIAMRCLNIVKSSSTFRTLSATQLSQTSTTLPSRDRTEFRKMIPSHRPISQSPVQFAGGTLPTQLPFPVGDDLMRTIRSSMWRSGTQPEGLAPVPPPRSGTNAREEHDRIAANSVRISVEDAKKLLHASRIETARKKLREIPMSCVPNSDFIKICREVAGGIDDTAREIASALDRSGTVVVLGNIVFLRPEQLARSIENAIIPPSDSERQLKDMEAAKAVIDAKAETQVRQELWAGLGLLVFQTAGFMRLTFWEFSWDVMEPICFFTTSLYFIVGWTFFMRTSKEPSFEGFFAGRLAAKQKKLMKARSFDLPKWNELRRALLVGSERCSNGCCCCHCHC